jgi:hypothetical protein
VSAAVSGAYNLTCDHVLLGMQSVNYYEMRCGVAARRTVLLHSILTERVKQPRLAGIVRDRAQNECDTISREMSFSEEALRRTTVSLTCK